jgi:hypothetical protein
MLHQYKKNVIFSGNVIILHVQLHVVQMYTCNIYKQNIVLYCITF